MKYLLTTISFIYFLFNFAYANEMPQVIETKLGVSPVTLRIPTKQLEPPIILYHGFGPPGDRAKLMNVLPLDDVPAIKVYVDLPLFGDRLPDGGLTELARRQKEDYGLNIFAPAVIGAVNEHTDLTNALAEFIETDKFEKMSVFGFSAGGAVALALLKQQPEKLSKVVIINAPHGLKGGVEAYERITGKVYNWNQNSRKLALKTQINDIDWNKLSKSELPALLLLHSENDEMIPFASSVEIHKTIRQQYYLKQAEGRLSFQPLKDMTHHWVNDGADTINRVEQLVSDWLKKPST